MRESGFSQKDLLRKFGYCVIPKGTFLYRSYNGTESRNCMFFALKFWIAGVFAKERKIVQVWKTKREIQVIFLVDCLTQGAWAKSNIPLLYQLVFCNERENNYNDLDIKYRDISRRDKFINTLYLDYGISGWLTSIEGAIELEICLFDREANQSQIEFIAEISKESNLYYKDSLKRIAVFPSKQFFIKTHALLNQTRLLPTKTKEIYAKYVRRHNDWIKEKATNKDELNKSLEKWYNLRVKLKI